MHIVKRQLIFFGDNKLGKQLTPGPHGFTPMQI